MDINTDPGCGRITGPDMTLGSGAGPDNAMVPGDNAGHLDLCGPRGGMALGQQHNHRLQPRPWVSCGLWWRHGS